MEGRGHDKNFLIQRFTPTLLYVVLKSAIKSQEINESLGHSAHSLSNEDNAHCASFSTSCGWNSLGIIEGENKAFFYPFAQKDCKV